MILLIIKLMGRKMGYCAVCGQDNEDHANFCRSCGATLTNNSFSKPKRNPPSTSYSKQKESVGFGTRTTGENLVLRCSLCGGEDFAQDSGRLDSKWGFTSFKVVMLTCKYCGHIELFNKGRSIWDFD